MPRLPFALAVLCLPTAMLGCSSDSHGAGNGDADAREGQGSGTDASLQPDATPGDETVDAMPPVACAVAPDLGDLGDLASGMVTKTADPEFLAIDQVIEPGELSDVFQVALFGDYQPFTLPRGAPGPIVPGTYEISGPQTHEELCGTCVEVYADVDASDNPKQLYVAQSGILTITKVAGRFAGSFAPPAGQATVTLKGFDLYDDATFSPNGCTTTVAGASWNKPIM